MVEEQILNQISNVGFPIVAFLLMWGFATRTMRQNTEAINQLKEAIIRLNSRRK